MFDYWGIPLIVFLIGAALLALGLRPRRVGQTPFCRTCGYNLTGKVLQDAAERCSECGTALTAGAVVYGERRRRPGWIALGAVCVLLGATPTGMEVAGALLGVDWYKYKPTSWVQGDAEGANLDLAKRAFTELDRRFVADTLSADDKQWFIEYCLKEEAVRPGRLGIQTGAVNVLWREYELGRLSAEQGTRMFEAMATCALRVRPKIRAGEMFEIEAGGDLIMPDRLELWVEIQRVGVVGGQELDESRRIESLTGRGSIGPGVWRTNWRFRAPGEPGTYSLEATVLLIQRSSTLGTASNGNSLNTLKMLPTISIDVCGDDSGRSVRGERNDLLDNEVRSGIWLKRHFWGGGEDLVLLMFESSPTIPVGLAFEVIVETGGVQKQVGTFYQAAGTAKDRTILAQWNGEMPNLGTVRLRASQKVADESIDALDYWPGELVFENVPLRGVDVNTTTAPEYWLPQIVSP